MKPAIPILLLILFYQSFGGSTPPCWPTYWKNADDTFDTSKCFPFGSLTKISHWAVQYPGQSFWYNFDPVGYGACCSAKSLAVRNTASMAGHSLIHPKSSKTH
jgi:hypothetical protein